MIEVDIVIRASDQVLWTITWGEDSFQQNCFVKYYRGGESQKDFDRWMNKELQMLEKGKAIVREDRKHKYKVGPYGESREWEVAESEWSIRYVNVYRWK